ncbi:uncharacterized protein UV8b_08205 [Ustilaginoidea virens]|uniref:Uncharacterized protein n=1 Tax=Ustilaginoidea virens TaxID=1159556 RepID=A0A8E5HYJ0_USTVR|nr:uncharacterized protein UV8b_08205 [Ustilaginoidea virens]QUC23964.1 hypothetical protein UV8b_08205 [Ustilaginoidea virens]
MTPQAVFPIKEAPLLRTARRALIGLRVGRAAEMGSAKSTTHLHISCKAHFVQHACLHAMQAPEDGTYCTSPSMARPLGEGERGRARYHSSWALGGQLSFPTRGTTTYYSSEENFGLWVKRLSSTSTSAAVVSCLARAGAPDAVNQGPDALKLKAERATGPLSGGVLPLLGEGESGESGELGELGELGGEATLTRRGVVKDNEGANATSNHRQSSRPPSSVTHHPWAVICRRVRPPPVTRHPSPVTRPSVTSTRPSPLLGV